MSETSIPKTRRKVLTIFWKPVMLTAEGVDQNVFTLAAGADSEISLTFVLRGDAAYYADRQKETDSIENDAESMGNPPVRWSWVAHHTGNAVYVVREDIESYGISSADVADGIEVVSLGQLNRLLDENDTILVY